MLEIHLLGGLLLVWQGQPLPNAGSALLPALLARLVLRPGVPLPRAELALCFWPDAPSDERARTNLRKLILELRRTLPEHARFVITNGPGLVWRADAPFTVDVVEFERLAKGACSAEELGRAVEAYTADLLPGCPDAWVEEERERLRAVFADLLERAIAEREVAGDLTGALAYADRLRRHDPLSEPAYCHLVHLYGCQGDRAAAERVYAACVRLLREEVDVEPGPTLRALMAQVRAGRLAPPPPAAPLAPPAPPPSPAPVPPPGRADRPVPIEAAGIEAAVPRADSAIADAPDADAPGAVAPGLDTGAPPAPVADGPRSAATALAAGGRPSRLVRLLRGAGIGALPMAAAFAFLQWWQAPADTLPGGDYPVSVAAGASAATAGRFIAVHGTSDGLPRRVRIWTVIRYQGEYWPQQAAFRGGGTWAGMARIGGGPADRGKTLDLLAVLADRAADDAFGEWLRFGYRTGEYPPLAALPEGARIAAATTVEVR